MGVEWRCENRSPISVLFAYRSVQNFKYFMLDNVDCNNCEKTEGKIIGKPFVYISQSPLHCKTSQLWLEYPTKLPNLELALTIFVFTRVMSTVAQI